MIAQPPLRLTTREPCRVDWGRGGAVEMGGGREKRKLIRNVNCCANTTNSGTTAAPNGCSHSRNTTKSTLDHICSSTRHTVNAHSYAFEHPVFFSFFLFSLSTVHHHILSSHPPVIYSHATHLQPSRSRRYRNYVRQRLHARPVTSRDGRTARDEGDGVENLCGKKKPKRVACLRTFIYSRPVR